MSLINDALKRAKQTQAETPTPQPTLEFRPVEPAQSEGRGMGVLLMSVALIVVAIIGIGGALVWFKTQKKTTALDVQARVVQQRSATTDAASSTSPISIVQPTVVTESIQTPVVDVVDEGGVTNEAVTAATADVAKVEPPNLQGIFFNPKNPSAIVNRKTVYLGDRVAGFFVLGISPSAVTLVNAAMTNVLSLSE